VRRHYENPPVVEALAEIFFAGSEWRPSVPGRFYERVKDRFPEEGRRDQVGLQLSVSPEQADWRLERGAPRSLFVSADQSQMVQVAPELLVHNQLHPSQERPYPHFEEWRPAVMEMLALYRELAKPKSIERLGLRYLNKIAIPASRFSMGDYFALYPYVPPDLAEEHGDFIMRIQIPSLHEGHDLLVTFGSAPSEQEAATAFLLDLYDVAAPVDPDDDRSIEQRFDQAHDNIIHAFEHAITPTARALFRETETGG
jgi:uncharacterized protein (TIGR04255 family)